MHPENKGAPDMMKELGMQWKQLDAEQRQIYDEMAVEGKILFTQIWIIWNSNSAEIWTNLNDFSR